MCVCCFFNIYIVIKPTELDQTTLGSPNESSRGIYIYIYIYIHMCVCVCVCVDGYECIYMYIYMLIFIGAYIYIYIYVCIKVIKFSYRLSSRVIQRLPF